MSEEKKDDPQLQAMEHDLAEVLELFAKRLAPDVLLVMRSRTRATSVTRLERAQLDATHACQDGMLFLTELNNVVLRRDLSGLYRLLESWKKRLSEDEPGSRGE